MKNNLSRPAKYKTGEAYWSRPNPRENDKDSYLDLKVRSKYSYSLVDALKLFFQTNEKFTLHEFGCGWGTNLQIIKKEFPNVEITANDIWLDAIDYNLKNRDYIKLFKQDTFEFIDYSIEQKLKFDVIITNAHLVHIENEKLLRLRDLHKICKRAIIQENIKNLEIVISLPMQLKELKETKLPDSEFRYIFEAV
jgi:2-polyprenyl-3-methyl-5-hydroxy-6-metoxy-1,4-benzoquinol methylase